MRLQLDRLVGCVLQFQPDWFECEQHAIWWFNRQWNKVCITLNATWFSQRFHQPPSVWGTQEPPALGVHHPFPPWFQIMLNPVKIEHHSADSQGGPHSPSSKSSPPERHELLQLAHWEPGSTKNDKLILNSELFWDFVPCLDPQLPWPVPRIRSWPPPTPIDQQSCRSPWFYLRAASPCWKSVF